MCSTPRQREWPIISTKSPASTPSKLRATARRCSLLNLLNSFYTGIFPHSSLYNKLSWFPLCVLRRNKTRIRSITPNSVHNGRPSFDNYHLAWILTLTLDTNLKLRPSPLFFLRCAWKARNSLRSSSIIANCTSRRAIEAACCLGTDRWWLQRIATALKAIDIAGSSGSYAQAAEIEPNVAGKGMVLCTCSHRCRIARAGSDPTS